MKKIISLSLLLVGSSVALLAAVPAPEIDASSATTAVMLLGAGVLMLRGRRSR
jgi:hypothetical protein